MFARLLLCAHLSLLSSSAATTSPFIGKDVEEIKQVAVLSKKEKNNLQLIFKPLKSIFKALNSDNLLSGIFFISNGYLLNFDNLLSENRCVKLLILLFLNNHVKSLLIKKRKL